MGSSDEEFVWTNTSNDDSDSEVEMPYNGESDSGKSYKKKLQKELFQNGELDSSVEAEEPRRKKKKHKRESSPPPPSPPPPSPPPPPPPRVKRELHDSAAAEDILRMKVKQERGSFVAPRDSPRKRRASSAEPEPQPKKKKKKREKKEEREPSPTEAVDEPESPRKKKKRKRDSERTSGGDRDVIIDKLEVEETVVQHRPKVNGHVRQERAEHRPQEYPSKEFIEDDDSSGEEAPAAPARLQVGGGASPRKARVSDRITFESQSESEPDPAPKPVEKSPGSSKRPRNTSEGQSRKTAEGQANGELPSISERITFEEPQAENESPERGGRISERIIFDESQSENEPSEGRRDFRERISERITFEESQGDSEPEPPRGSARLARFLRAHAHLRAAAGAGAGAGAGGAPRAAALGAHDELWLVRAPAALPAAALRGRALPVRGRLKLDGRAWEAAPAPAAARVALLLPCAGGAGGWRVRAVALRGALRLRPRLPRARAPPGAGDAPAPERVSPPDTRPRHPLLGVDYERAAELAPDVRRRLAAARAREDPGGAGEPDAPAAPAGEPREKKNKKKKHRERPEPEPEPKEERPAEEPKKHKRKASSRTSPEPVSPAASPRKKKAKRERPEPRDDAAVWDSERAIEENLFDF